MNLRPVDRSVLFLLFMTLTASAGWVVQDVPVPAGSVDHLAPQHTAIGPDGTFHVVWNGRPAAGQRFDVYYARYRNGTWSVAENLSNNPAVHDRAGDVAVTPGGKVIVVFWRDAAGEDAFEAVARVREAEGMPWSGTVLISTNTVRARLPSITAYGEGGALCVWMQRDAGQTYEKLGYALYTGSTWLPSASVPGSVLDGWGHPDVAQGADGRARAIWCERSGDAYYVRLCTYNGLWGSIETLWAAPGGANAQIPSLTRGLTGALDAVWLSGVENTLHVYQSQQPVNGDWSLPSSVAYGHRPQVAQDRFGGVHLVYTNANQVYYRKRHPNGTWSTEERVSDGSTVGTANWGGVGVNQQDTVVVVWEQGRENSWVIRAAVSDIFSVPSTPSPTPTTTISPTPTVTNTPRASISPTATLPQPGSSLTLW